VPIVCAWVFAPLATASASALIMVLCRTLVLRRPNPAKWAMVVLPLAVFITTWVSRRRPPGAAAARAMQAMAARSSQAPGPSLLAAPLALAHAAAAAPLSTPPRPRPRPRAQVNIYFVFTKGAKKALQANNTKDGNNADDWTDQKALWIAAVCAAGLSVLTAAVAVPLLWKRIESKFA
jgi:phosphate/sulfate permease